MTFEKRIWLFRRNARKSQKMIEAETGIPQRTLSDWEHGNSEPTASGIKKLEKAYGVIYAEILHELRKNAQALRSITY